MTVNIITPQKDCQLKGKSKKVFFINNDPVIFDVICLDKKWLKLTPSSESEVSHFIFTIKSSFIVEILISERKRASIVFSSKKIQKQLHLK